MYRLHKEALAIAKAYPELFSSVTRHKGGTATLRLVQFPNNALLLTVINYLDRDGVHVIHYQFKHHPFTVKLSTRRTIVAESFKSLLKRRSLFIPTELTFEHPITASEAAAITGISVQYARILARDGTFESVKASGVHYISRDSVISFRTDRMYETLLEEFGTAIEPIVKIYLEQPPELLPLKTRVKKSVIEHFDDWVQNRYNDIKGET